MAIQVLIVDDHLLARCGLRAMLAESEVEVCGEADSGEAALEQARRQRPDVILLDVRLPNGDGLTTMGRLKVEFPTVPVLFVSTYDNPTYISRAISLGAAGYLLKGTDRESLLTAIRQAARGENVWSREDLRRVTGALATPRLNANVEVPLTQRESEVLRQLAIGLTNKEIAVSLHIGFETVKEHVQHILRKIGVTDRTQAAVWAVRNGLV